MVRKVELGKTGIKVPVLGQGTWTMGEDLSRRHSEIDALCLGVQEGMSLIDTAESYADGEAEKIVGEVIKQVGRENVFIVSKVSADNHSYEGIHKAVRGSLSRLGTDWIDLYLLHWPSGRHSLKETMKAMKSLLKFGNIRFVGVSNFDVSLMIEAQEALGEVDLVSNQVEYNLENRIIEKSIMPYCNTNYVNVMAYSPFGRNKLKDLTDYQFDVLSMIAQNHETDLYHKATIYQVVLNWIVSHQNVIAISKASDRVHVRENVDSLSFELSNYEKYLIEKVFPVPPGEFQVKWGGFFNEHQNRSVEP